MTRLLAITQGENDPSTRYRLGLYLPFFEAAGVAVTPKFWPRESTERERLVARASDYDAVAVFRRLLPLRFIDGLRRRAKWLAYDFDDDVTRRDSTWGWPWPLVEKVFQFRALAPVCDAVTAGNAHLAELARDRSHGDRISVVPTVVDVARFGPPRPSGVATPGAPVIGWIGQKSTLTYLSALRRPIEKLRARWPGLVLRILADQPPRWAKAGVEWESWSEAREVHHLQRFDVGVSPLPDDAWTRAKCGLRALQYFAAGTPAVISPVGVQGDFVKRGVAIAASTPDEWVARIEMILDDAEQRSRLVAKGRTLVERFFSPAAWFPHVARQWLGFTPMSIEPRTPGRFPQPVPATKATNEP